MLDKFIIETANNISFTKVELSNIALTLNSLKDIINGENEFQEPFLGGSYKRATMVKGISDVDVYFRYVGLGSPARALGILKNRLIQRYHNTTIRRDTPSILAEFEKIPINITPYKEDNFGNMSIPSDYDSSWQSINFGTLEAFIAALRNKNPKFIELIKVLKLWNKNNNKGIKNFEIEKRVCDIFVYPNVNLTTISDWLYTFLSSSNYQLDANKIFPLMMITEESTLKREWHKFLNL